MKRRQLLGAAALGGLALATAGVAGLPREGQASATGLDEARERLAGLRGRTLRSLSGWSPAEVFNHCAQSVEYSMDGYPQLRADWFRGSLGPLAFALFSARGAMRHPLDEAIPGAPDLLSPAGQDAALARLEAAFERFARHRGPLQPHFAYGALSHAEYGQAHVMHLYEHLTLIRIDG